MTLEELKNYRSYCLEREEIKCKLKSGKSEDSSVRLLYCLNEIDDKINTIKQFVNNISDYKIHRALKIYCIEPLDENTSPPSWENVANRIGNGATGDSIRVSVSRYFKKTEKKS